LTRSKFQTIHVVDQIGFDAITHRESDVPGIAANILTAHYLAATKRQGIGRGERNQRDGKSSYPEEHRLSFGAAWLRLV
jgi:hypothetical protein